MYSRLTGRKSVSSQPVQASSALFLKFCLASHAASSSFSGISMRSILKMTGLVPSLLQQSHDSASRKRDRPGQSYGFQPGAAGACPSVPASVIAL
jgi:hypothetical protein